MASLWVGVQTGVQKLFRIGRSQYSCGIQPIFRSVSHTSKGVRFHPPDALFHWETGRIVSGGIH